MSVGYYLIGKAKIILKKFEKFEGCLLSFSGTTIGTWKKWLDLQRRIPERNREVQYNNIDAIINLYTIAEKGENSENK